ncbi:MAG: hypothetical protein KGM98_05635 [Bacteroidota bacterium]|nr:hypothetical protein [Bacteroidota bacterium]
MKFLFFWCTLFLISLSAAAQDIKYSDPDPADVNLTNFDIIGKVSGNYLVYKNLRNRRILTIFDNDMKVKDAFKLQFMPDRTLSAEFIAYPDSLYAIYQYQKRSAMYAMAVEMDGNGKVLRKPFALDTTHLGFFSNSRIYNVIYSEDRSKILLYKIQKKYETFTFTTLLFNSSLQLLHKSVIGTNFDDYRNSLSDFYVDNNGNFVFTVGDRQDSRYLQQQLLLAVKPADADSIELHPVNLFGKYLSEVFLKIDNLNQRYVINSLYYSRKNSNVDGLFSAFWDIRQARIDYQSILPFDESLKNLAKSQGNARQAFNDYFIRDVILKRDGGFILTAEDRSVNYRYNGYGFPFGSPLSPFSYYNPYIYSPYMGGYYNPYYNNGGNSRYYYDNIAVFDVSPESKLNWKTVVTKSQYDDNTDNYLSYSIMLTGGKLHFLYNEMDRHFELLKEQIMSPDGSVVREPPFRSLDKGYEFMPKYAKQVSSYQMVLPCTFRNYICFSKIEF